MIIGLCGYAQAGKTSAANILKEIAGFEVVSFADALRELAAEVNPPVAFRPSFTGQSVEFAHYNEVVAQLGYEGAKNNYTDVREFLQRLGVGVRTVLGEYAWVDALDAKIEALYDAGVDDEYANVAIPDVRFTNEARYVKDAGGQLWRIVRPGVGAANDHPSETTQEGFKVDREIVATNMEELRAAVAAAYAEVVQ